MQFDESKHPRDKDGKFTDGKGTTKEAYDSRDTFGNMIRNMPQGAKERVSEISSGTEKPKRPEPEKAYGFANKERRETAHHMTHAKEMGFKHQRDYEQAAVDFFNSSRGKLYYSKLRGRYYRYDEKTGELVVSSNGVIHTYLKRTKKEFQRAVKQDGLHEN